MDYTAIDSDRVAVAFSLLMLGKMDLDFSSLWSWTIPLWSLFLIVLFLGGVITDSTVWEAVADSAPLKGGALSKKRVRFSLNHS